MKSAVELREQIEEYRDQIEAICDKAEVESRDLTDAEDGQVKNLVKSIKKAEGQLETRLELDSERKAKFYEKITREGLLGDTPRNTRIQPTMHDTQGRPVYCLSKDQRIADTLETKAVDNGMGEAIRAAIVGVNRFTPEGVKAALSTNNGLSGGFLVPEELSANVIDLARARSVVLAAGAQTVPMSTSYVTMAKVSEDPTIVAKGENDAFTSQDITFGAITLGAYTIGTMITASRELAEDAPNFSQLIEGVLSAKLAQALDSYAIQGSGSQEPAGLTINANISETGSVGAIAWEDLAAAASAVRQNNHQPNSIIMGVEPHEDLLILAGGDGTNSSKQWLGAPPALDGVTRYATNNCPLAYAICGDFTKLAWGIRTNAMIEMSTSANEAFERHQVKIKIVFRGDFAVMDSSAFHRLAGITS